MQKPETDLETFRKAEPFVRSLCAFAIFLCGRQPGGMPHNLVKNAYGVADEFIAQLEKDLGA